MCRVAVVAARLIKNGVGFDPPRVDLYWGDLSDAEFSPTTNWVMVESSEENYLTPRFLPLLIKIVPRAVFFMLDFSESFTTPMPSLRDAAQPHFRLVISG